MTETLLNNKNYLFYFLKLIKILVIMRFRIIPLEERIVLDAAGTSEIIDSYAFEHHALADKAGVTPDMTALAVDSHHLMDHAGSADSANRVLVISSQVKDSQLLTKASLDNVKVVYYNPDTTSLKDLSAKISSVLDGKRADSIAFVNYGSDGQFALTQGQIVSMDTLNSSQDLQTFWQDVSHMIKQGGKVDLLACNVVASADGMNLVSKLDNLLNDANQKVSVDASSNPTGNPSSGGDWLLETGQVDAAKTYFNTIELASWSGLLDNLAPVAKTDSYVINQDQLLTTNILLNDSDPEGATLTLDKIISQPIMGKLTFSNDGIIKYQPDLNKTGVDSFTYQASDGSLDSKTTTVYITINPTDLQAPTIQDDSFTGPKDQIIAGNVLTNDPGVTGGTIRVINSTVNGVLSYDNAKGDFTYKPTTGYQGSDSFTYLITSPDGSASRVATVSLLIGNSAPISVDDNFSTNEDIVLNGNVLLNDNDPNNDTMTALVSNNPTHGTLVFNNNGTFTYTPDANYSGSDFFTYQASDGISKGNVAKVQLTVNPVNGTPVAVNDSFISTNNQHAISGNVLTNDQDVEGSPLTATLKIGPTHGILSLNPNGSFTYQADARYYGTDSFTYQTSDGSLLSNEATVMLNTLAPFSADFASTNPTIQVEGTPQNYVIDFTVTSPNVNVNSLDYSINWGDQNFFVDKAHDTGATLVQTGTNTFRLTTQHTYYKLLFENNVSFNTPIPITITVKDNTGNSATSTMTTQITQAPFPTLTTTFNPLIVDLNSTFSGSIATLNYGAYDSNSISTYESATISWGDGTHSTGNIVPTSTFGVYNINTSHTFGFSDSNNSNISISFSNLNESLSLSTTTQLPYQINLPLSVIADSSTIAVDNYAVSNKSMAYFVAPVIGDSSKHYHATINWGDGSSSSGIMVPTPANSPHASAGSAFTYFDILGTHSYAYDGQYQATITLTDDYYGSSTTSMTMNISHTNSAPTAIGLSNNLVISTDPAGKAIGTLTASDPDAVDTITFSLLDHQNAFYIQDNTLYVKDARFALINEGTNYDTLVKIRATDPGGLSLDQSFNIHIDVPPVAINDGIVMNQGSNSVNINAISNDTDPNNDSLIISKATISSPSHGIVKFLDNGTLDYLLTDSNFVGIDSFTYVVSDGTVHSNRATVYITVNAAGTTNTPLVQDSRVAVMESHAKNGDVLFDDKQAQGKLKVISLPSHGKMDLSNFEKTGVFIYTPNDGYVGFDSFSYYIEGFNGSLSRVATVSLDVLDAPLVTSPPSIITIDSATPFNGVIASFSDSGNPNHDTSIYLATTTWTLNGNQSFPTTIVYNSETGQFDVSLNHDFSNFTPVNGIGEGFYTVSIKDSSGASAQVSSRFGINITPIDVIDNPLNLQASTGLPIENIVVATFTGGATLHGLENSFTSDIDWGDGVNSEGTISAPNANGVYTVYGSHTYSQEGNYTIIVKVNDIINRGDLIQDNISVMPTNVLLDNASINENSANGSLIGNLSILEPNIGNSASFSIVNNVSGLFAINGNQLVVADGSLLNYEANSSYQIVIRATNPAGLSIDKVFTIAINNVNEAPTALSLSKSSINENSANGSVIGFLAGVDQDLIPGTSLSEPLTYSLIDNAGGRFAINGNQLIVADGSLLNYEANRSYPITARVTDPAGLSFDKTFTITVNNVNEAPTALSLSNSSINENPANGSVVGLIIGEDPDLISGTALNDYLTYSLIDNAGGRFALDGNQLIVADGSLLGYEANHSPSITVRVTDSGGLSLDKTFTITVNNVNNAPTALSLSSSSINENSANGIFICFI
jgi:VCBS repeat-containing protein